MYIIYRYMANRLMAKLLAILITVIRSVHLFLCDLLRVHVVCVCVCVCMCKRLMSSCTYEVGEREEKRTGAVERLGGQR